MSKPNLPPLVGRSPDEFAFSSELVTVDEAKSYAEEAVRQALAAKPLGYVAVLNSPCGARYFSRITNDGQARMCTAQWAKEYADVKPGPWPTEAVAVYASPQASEAVQLLRQVREQDFLSDTMRHRIDRLLDRAALASPETRDG